MLNGSIMGYFFFSTIIWYLSLQPKLARKEFGFRDFFRGRVWVIVIWICTRIWPNIYSFFSTIFTFWGKFFWCNFWLRVVSWCYIIIIRCTVFCRAVPFFCIFHHAFFFYHRSEVDTFFPLLYLTLRSLDLWEAICTSLDDFGLSVWPLTIFLEYSFTEWMWAHSFPLHFHFTQLQAYFIVALLSQTTFTHAPLIQSSMVKAQLLLVDISEIHCIFINQIWWNKI